MRILALAGSLRAGSHNLALVREARRLAPADVEVAIWEGLRALPHYDADLDAAPADPAVADLRAAIAAADALLVATPEYNGSVPGVLKNAVDWASRPFPGGPLQGIPAAVIGATTGSFGAVWAQADLRKALGISGARVLEEGLALPHADRAFDGDGRLVSAEHRDELTAVLTAVAAEARARAARAA
ncbi:MAG: NAD(P)H-dependent oxidoreductase [Actinomycetota bacterium]